MGDWPTQSVNDFRGRALPEPGVLAGYAALITRYDLDVPLPVRLAATAERHHPASTEAWLMLTPRHRPDDTLVHHLTFAFRYEGVDLQILSRLFKMIAAADIEAIVRTARKG